MSSQAMGDAFALSPYKGGVLLVHLAAADVVNDMHGNRLWMTNAMLARKARVSVPTVERALRLMEHDGWVRTLTPGGGRGKPTEYQYHLGGKPPQHDGLSVETPSFGSETPSSNGSHPLIEPKEPKAIPADVQQVFNAWVESAEKTGRTRLDPKRQQIISRALREYPLSEVLDAVRGWRRSPYHRGQNERRTVYNDLGLLLRDAAHIERFRDLERSGGKHHDPHGLNADRNVQ